MYYALIRNNKIIGFQELPVLDEDIIQVEVSKSVYDKALEKGINYYTYQNGEIIKNPDYEQEEEEKERERIDNLELTAADVERAIYEAKGMDFEDLIQHVIDSEITGLDIKRLKIELKANHFIRKHPYINVVGQILGYTSEDMDILFKTKQLPKKED